MNSQLDKLLGELQSLINRENSHSLDTEALNRVAEKIYDYALTNSALGASPVEALIELKTLPKNEVLNIWREWATGALEMYRCMARQHSESANKIAEMKVAVAPIPAKPSEPQSLSSSHPPIAIKKDQPATEPVETNNVPKKPSKPSTSLSNNDLFDLRRFIDAQEGVYDRAVTELRNGWKQSHWMWYIFPQIDGLGRSSTTKYYAIKSIEEAHQFLNHPVLGVRLRECVETLLALEGDSASDVLGYTDALKLKSSMTLFASLVNHPDSIFAQLLDKYYQGERDKKTVSITERL